MLKVLPNFALTNNYSNNKCGEIFYQNSTSFTIVCTFCDMKIFELEDFFRHFKNVHFTNNLLNSEENNAAEPSSYLETNIKKEEVDRSNFVSVESTDPISSLFEKEAAEENSEISSDGEDWAGNVDDYDHDDDDDKDDKDFKIKVKKKPTTKNDDDEKKYECENCKKLYKTERYLKYHVCKSPNGNVSKAHKCNQCSEILPTVRQLNAHTIKEHLGFQCSQCEKKCRSNFELKRHEIKHTGIKNFVCDFENCAKRFYTRRQLTVHRHVHTDPKNFICETCGYSCRIKETLKIHYRSHTGEKPYACDMCDKRFASHSLLKEHKPIHSTERPHICGVCGASFSRPKALYHHKHLHLGVKKFKCKLCGNAYAQAAGLAGHMRQHKAELF